MGLEDYVDVAERISEFFARYPNGRLRPHRPWEIRAVGERLFVAYEAAAYRDPEDPMPGIGSAWEPWPGPTPFTRDSELMNAETAAWGRAIVAVGIPARRIATLQDLQARQAPAEPPAAEPEPAAGKPTSGASGAQRKKIHALLTEKQITRIELASMLDRWNIELKTGWMDMLTPGRAGTASQLLDTLADIPTPLPGQPSDDAPAHYQPPPQQGVVG